LETLTKIIHRIGGGRDETSSLSKKSLRVKKKRNGGKELILQREGEQNSSCTVKGGGKSKVLRPRNRRVRKKREGGKKLWIRLRKKGNYK